MYHVSKQFIWNSDWCLHYLIKNVWQWRFIFEFIDNRRKEISDLTGTLHVFLDRTMCCMLRNDPSHHQLPSSSWCPFRNNFTANFSKYSLNGNIRWHSHGCHQDFWPTQFVKSRMSFLKILSLWLSRWNLWRATRNSNLFSSSCQAGISKIHSSGL